MVLKAAFPARRGHPFRRALPRRVLMRLPEYEPEVRAAIEVAERAETALILPEPPAPLCAPPSVVEPRRRRITVQDVKEFLMAYCACFLAVSSFIS